MDGLCKAAVALQMGIACMFSMAVDLGSRKKSGMM